MNRNATLDRLLERFALLGGRHYGEDVTQRAHMEQSAYVAAKDGAPDALIAAALLHDYGHFLQRRGEDAADHGIDTRHEVIGANYLARYFPESVAGPIRLHVNAKRYLCAVKPDYHDSLSAASRQSLVLQGGIMTAGECAAFLKERFAEDAIRLRWYDEEAKRPGLAVPAAESYRPMLLALMAQRGQRKRPEKRRASA